MAVVVKNASTTCLLESRVPGCANRSAFHTNLLLPLNGNSIVSGNLLPVDGEGVCQFALRNPCGQKASSLYVARVKQAPFEAKRSSYFFGRPLHVDGLAQTFRKSPKTRQDFMVLCKEGGVPKRLEVASNISMNDIFEMLAHRLIRSADSIPSGQKYIVGVAGSPGSGKTTLARSVTTLINSLQPDPDLAISVPMDGYHLYRKQLDQMPDPKEAHARRGSHWTFDPLGLLATLKTIRNEGEAAVPSFDHGVGDPVDGDIKVKSENKIVIVEGNYLLLDADNWRDLREVFDETWFLEVDIDVAMQRVLGRHMKTGKPPDIAEWRVSYNDRPNGLLIAETASRADLLIPSLNMVVEEAPMNSK